MVYCSTIHKKQRTALSGKIPNIEKTSSMPYTDTIQINTTEKGEKYE